MHQDDGRSNAGEGGEPPRDLGADLRRVAHDINGALNTLALNIELLDRATAAGGAAPVTPATPPAFDTARQVARDRSLGSLRRAVGEIQQIVGLRLVPLASRDSDPESGGR